MRSIMTLTTGPTLSIILLSLAAARPFAAALSNGPINNHQLSRRDALIGAASSTAAISGIILSSPERAIAAPLDAESVDLAAFNAARVSSSSSAPKPLTTNVGTAGGKIRHSIIPTFDPSPLLPIRGGRSGKSTIQIPRVGYSLYKTKPEQDARCVSLALRCGIRHFDVASLYNSNSEVSKPLKQYLDGGLSALQKSYTKDESSELLNFLDATSATADEHAIQTIGFQSKSISPPIDGSAGRKARREQLFISHKLSNAEQSTNMLTVKRSVKAAIAELGVGYLDMISIHSPLTDRGRRVATYQALLELRDSGFVKSVGVCNYGIGPLNEIQELVGNNPPYNNMPAVNQLEMSPFNTHEDVVRYCDTHGIAVGCSAWSKLSGVDGPSEGWNVLADLAKLKGVTKAQLLVRWSLQRGYVCLPRSGSSSKLERVAIAENSYGGVNLRNAGNEGDASFVLTQEDMKILDGLDIGYKAGKLGRRDGWDDEDVVGPEWDPTDIV